MLAIVITALLIMTHSIRPQSISSTQKWLVCASTWIMPLITSIAAVALRSIAPVSGNGCWISAARPDIQYPLAYGWRLAVIFTVVLSYAYMAWLVYSRSRARQNGTGQNSLDRSKLGSPYSHTSRKDGLVTRHITTSTDSCDSAGSWALPIQSPGPYGKSPPRTTKTGVVMSPRRQIGHVNSMYHLGPPPRIQTPRQENRQEDREDWLREVLNISRYMNPVRKSLENRPSARDSSDTGSDFLIQLPEALVDEKPLDNRPVARPNTSSAAIDATGRPNEHNQGPKVTKSFVAPEDRALVPAPLDVKPGPIYHNQCPKVTKSFQVSVGDGKKPGPRYHNQCPKVTRTIDVSTNRIPTPPRGNTEAPGPRYHNQCPKVTRTIDVSTNRVATQDADETPGPRYHNQFRKVTRSIDRITSPSPLHSEAPGPHYHNQCPKVTRMINISVAQASPPLSSTRTEVPGPQTRQQQSSKAEHSVNVSTSQAGPNYHSECPLVKRSVSVSSDPMTPNANSDASPQYHNQCPKVVRSVQVTSSSAAAGHSARPPCPVSPSKPLPPLPPALLTHGFKTETTILTSPTDPPPSPTPGLPPPPWSPAANRPSSSSRIQFRKPAIFNKSTWSDSSQSSPANNRKLDPVTATTGATRKVTFTSLMQNATQGWFSRGRCSSSTVSSNLRGDEEQGDVATTTTTTTTTTTHDGTASSSSVPVGQPAVRSALLLNAYPLSYVILWLPWVVDRFMEAEGARSSNARVMAVLLACPQWLPLTNALTLGVSVCYLRWRGASGSGSGSGSGTESFARYQASSRGSF